MEPKRFLNSFMLFSGEERKSVQDQLGTTKPKRVAKALAKKWRNLPDDDKKRFEDEALEGKQRWLSEKQAFELQSGGDNSQAAIETDAPQVPEEVSSSTTDLPGEASFDQGVVDPDSDWGFPATPESDDAELEAPGDDSTYVWGSSSPDLVQ